MNCLSATTSPRGTSGCPAVRRSISATSNRRSWCSAPRATTSRRRSRRWDWILDCYVDVDDVRAHGQTIVYTVHESVGHLGIFVSGGVAKKEHAEFSSNIDLIDVLPPGLYETTFEARGPDTLNDDLAVGQWVMRCEARSLDDIRAMGGNSPEDERRFEAAKRVSEMNLEAYQKYVQPWVKSIVTPQMAELMRNWHPLRLQYKMLNSRIPLMTAVANAADKAREERKPVTKDNPFLTFQERISKQIVSSLDQWRDLQERAQRSNVPRSLRLARIADRGRHRSKVRAFAPARNGC